MRDIKLYNVIFPIWFIMFYPPIILVTLAGNFIIDSLVLLASAYAFGLVSADQTLGLIYKDHMESVGLRISCRFYRSPVLIFLAAAGRNAGAASGSDLSGCL